VRIRKIAGAIAGAGLMTAVLAAPASAASTPINVVAPLHPYAIVSANATYGTFGVGSTAPNQPSGELCLEVALASNNSLWLSNTDSGNVGNVSGTVPYIVLDQTLAQFSPAQPCVLNTTNVTTTGKVTPTVGQVQFAGITTSSGIDRGIKSGTSTTYTVSKPSGATVAAPQCSLVLTTNCYDPAKLTVSISNPAPTLSVVTVTGVNSIISKPKLDLVTPGACVLEEHDVTPTSGAFANTGTWTGSYKICAETAGQNIIKSAPFTVNVTGSPGAGGVALTAVQTVTSSVQLWDQTLANQDINAGPLGTCKVIDQVSRGMQCKGDWGAVVPLNIAVRKGSPVTGGAPYGAPAGLNDPDGITTPLPVAIGSGAL
jgi:hypothetical protein